MKRRTHASQGIARSRRLWFAAGTQFCDWIFPTSSATSRWPTEGFWNQRENKSAGEETRTPRWNRTLCEGTSASGLLWVETRGWAKEEDASGPQTGEIFITKLSGDCSKPLSRGCVCRQSGLRSSGRWGWWTFLSLEPDYHANTWATVASICPPTFPSLWLL